MEEYIDVEKFTQLYFKEKPLKKYESFLDFKADDNNYDFNWFEFSEDGESEIDKDIIIESSENETYFYVPAIYPWEKLNHEFKTEEEVSDFLIKTLKASIFKDDVKDEDVRIKIRRIFDFWYC